MLKCGWWWREGESDIWEIRYGDELHLSVVFSLENVVFVDLGTVGSFQVATVKVLLPVLRRTTPKDTAIRMVL